MSWLLYCHAGNSKDYKSLAISLGNMKKRLKSGTIVYTIIFGPTINSTVYLIKIQKGLQNEPLLTIRLQDTGTGTVLEITKKMVKYLVTKRINIKGITLYAHGSGFLFGPWKSGNETPFLDITDFTNFVIKPLKPKILVYDSCYQGSMTCLYEMPSFVKVTIASPGFHPYTSVIETQAFCNGLSFDTTTSKLLLDYAHQIVHQWHKVAKESFKCLLVFDMKFIPIIAETLKKYHFSSLHFDKQYSRIDPEDSNLHDLYTASRYIPELQEIILESLHANCKECLNNITKSVLGPSVEKGLYKKWQHHYRKTKWYKKIMND